MLIKLQREIMAVEETLARYKAWVAEHPQVAHFFFRISEMEWIGLEIYHIDKSKNIFSYSLWVMQRRAFDGFPTWSDKTN